MDITTITKLEKYITDEINDAYIYEELSKYAPSEDARNTLLDLSVDQKNNAMMFLSIYRDELLRDFKPQIQPITATPETYFDLIKKQTLKEIADYRQFEKEYLQENSNSRLKEAYYNTRTGSNVLALSLLYLLQ